MSNLYIRVKTSFYAHRKTLRLKVLLGEDAYWIPPRMWAYAAEHKPDGDLSEYDSMMLADVLGCFKHTTSIKQALLDAGFLDADGMIHDWAEHNGYHEKFSARAKLAADKRWEEVRRKKELKAQQQSERGNRKVESGGKHCISNAPSINGFDSFWERYPRKVGKSDAKKAFEKNVSDDLLPIVLSAVEAQSATVDWQKEGGRFVPHPTTWLNGRRWEDDLLGAVRNGQEQSDGPNI